MLHQSNFPGYFKSKPLAVSSNLSLNYLLDKKSIFWTPDYVDVSAWIEHLPFAFWIIEVLQPKVVVELGVHTGTSYFAFCQAVDRLNLETACYGIDTWKGDEHTGFYNEDIYSKVASYNANRYSKFSTLIRSTFNDAKNYFIDGSIDLLHIDGAHTYEAVKEDFESWLPKLSPGAIVIFHDINVRERNFGVFRLWDELKEQYRHFQFDFGFGLGILALGKTDWEEIDQLFDSENSDPYHLFLRNFFFERGNLFKKNFEISAALTHENQNREAEKKDRLQLAEKYQALLEENRKQTEDSKDLLLKSQALLDEVSRKLEETNTNNLQLQTEIIKQTATLKWYRDTYEDRSILGVVKEKLKSRSKKKITYSLNPAKNITNLPGSNEYTTAGEDPFFKVDFKEKRLKSGWYWLSIDIAELKGLLLAPMLYYDYGRGFNEKDVWNLPGSSNGKMECLIKFPYDILRLRFDPTTTECTFDIKEFRLRRVGKIKAFQLGMSRYKQLHCPGKRNLSFYAGLMASVLISGKAELRRKFWDSITSKSENSFDNYKKWCALYDTVLPAQYEKIRTFTANLTYQPLFSIIVPVYNAPVDFLKKAIESVRNQAYKNWELCIADDNSTNEDVRKLLEEYQAKDSRIKVVFRETNGHISAASNSALELAAGDFMVLLDQDDELPLHCLYMVAAAINKNRGLGIIYSDEDKIDEKGNRFDPYFKTDWNKDLFYGQNMISHLGVYKLSLIRKIAGFRVGFEGSQDYDLALRCIEHLKPEQIHHIPHVLYHWRAVKGSTAVTVANKNYAVDAGLRALRDHFKRTRQKATPERNVNNSYRIKWALPENEPLVSIIIPTKNKIDILSTCVSSILQKTSYSNFEVLIIDNNSKEALALTWFEQIQREHKQIKVYPYNGEFNFSAINNYGVQQSNGEIVVLLNNDTSVINNDWLSEMVSLCLREEIGVVGAKLFYPNGQIQHAGVFLYEGHPGNHIYLKRNSNDPGYLNKLNLVQNYSAVTAACLAVRRELYIKAGGLDDKNLKVAYNDVDFCLKIRELGYRNLWTPFAQLFHYESLSRGSDLNEVNLERFKREHTYMLTKWKNVISRDPFFNPNLDPAFDPTIDPSIVRFAFPPPHLYEWQKETINEHKEQSVEL